MKKLIISETKISNHRKPGPWGLSAALALALGLFGARSVARAGVAAYGGSINPLAAPPASVQTGVLESDIYIQLFTEQRGVWLAADLNVDLISPGTYDVSNPAVPGVIPHGTTVNSYFLHLDRVGSTATTALILKGDVVFDEEILGVIFSDANLDASDSIVGSPTTGYSTAESLRGLLATASDLDTVVWSGTSTIEVELPNYTVTDQVRIITSRKSRNVTFSIDRQSASVGTRVPAFGTGTATPVPVNPPVPALGPQIGEGDILTVGTASPGPNPPVAAPPTPGVFISSASLLPAAMAAREIDALSFGHDEPDGRLYFSVDKFAAGRTGAPAAPLAAEIAGNEASADVFRSVSASPLLGPAIAGCERYIDGDGSSHPGIGLLEPNPLHVAGTYPDSWPDSGDNIDALDIGTKPEDLNGFIYFSLDGGLWDPLRTTQWIPDPTGAIPAGGVWARPGGYGSVCQMEQALTGATLCSIFSPADIFVTTVGGVPTVYATAADLGLNKQDDVDALALEDNSLVNGEIVHVRDGQFDASVDRIYFSLRRLSPTIGLTDSLLGLAIEPGDVLTAPAAGGTTPAIAVKAEDLGLRTRRSGAPLPSGEPDDLVALDFVLDASATPAINNVPDQTVQENQTAEPINLVISDPDTPASELVLSGLSSNPSLVPNTNIVFSGSGTNRTVCVTPIAGQSGSATITIVVSDGESSAKDNFTLTVTPAPRPDLQVSTQSPVVTTENIARTLTLTVSNRGPATATDVRLAANLPEGVRVAAATNSAGTCQLQGSSNVTCSVASLSSNGTFTVDLTLRPNFLPVTSDLSVNLGDLTAFVSSSEGDLNPADNSLALPVTVRAQTDWGDARGGFPVTLAENGAFHRYSANGPWLGARWDNETPTGVHSLLADWDDTHGASGDEDGIMFPTPLVPGALATVVVTSTADGFLDAWTDFNNNSTWADPGEQIFASQRLVRGTNTFTFAVPASGVPGLTTTRWRASTTGGLSYTGYGGPGEVEDHLILVRAMPQASLKHSDGVSRLTFQTETQANYQVEYADSLTTPSWTPLTRVAGTGEAVVVTDNTTSPMRFYRVRVE